MTSRRTLLTGLALLPAVARATANTDYDVVVIGSGLAGLRAAVAARDAGARRVVILEKGPLVGGHSLYSCGTLSAVAPWRSHTGDFTDSVTLFVKDALTIGGGTGDVARLAAIARGAAAELDWLESLGVFFRRTLYRGFRAQSPLLYDAGQSRRPQLHDSGRRLRHRAR